MREWTFQAKHSVFADTEDEARKILASMSQEFTDNAVVIKSVYYPYTPPQDKFKFEKWSYSINGCMGTIRTVPENYYVASVFAAGYLTFDGIEANTRFINEDTVREWWAQKRGERLKRGKTQVGK